MIVLTKTQRDAIEKIMRQIGDGLCRYQEEQRLSNLDMANVLGCGVKTYRKIKDGESVERSTEEVLWMMILAGMWRI